MVRSSFVFVTSILMLLAHAVAADGDEAMFGLRWGMTIAEVRAAGLQLKMEQADRNLEIFSAQTVPKPISNAESYTLVFGDGRLAKIRYVSKNITEDSLGTSGKERFEQLKAALTEKYGPPDNNFQRVGLKLYKEPDEFYQCLAYDGCGFWGSVFKSSDKHILLELKGLRRGGGYVGLSAEAVPQFGEALRRQKAQQGKSDKDGL